MSTRFTSRQLAIVLLIAAVQFVNILDFVIVMPLGPDFADALGIPEAQLGYTNGAYTAAACIAGLLGSLFLDRFDRRKALAVALGGLVIGTAAGGFATGFTTLLLARTVAGAFGGPATSLAFSIIADTIPTHIRGKAMGIVMGAFSVAAVLGVPAGLWLAEHFGWRAPFFSVAGIGVLIGAASISLLPPLREHLASGTGDGTSTLELVSKPNVQLSYLLTATVMIAGFAVIPNIAAFVQLNLGLPRELLKWAYLFGGVASFFATQGGGRLVDRFGSFTVGTAGTALVVAVVFFSFYLPWTSLPAWVVIVGFVAFMFANGVRNVSYNTLTTKVPDRRERARFQSLQSAVQHGSAAFAAFLSAQLLVTSDRPPLPDDLPGRIPRMLEGMPHVALVTMVLSLAIPVMLFNLERRVLARAAAGQGTPDPPEQSNPVPARVTTIN